MKNLPLKYSTVIFNFILDLSCVASVYSCSCAFSVVWLHHRRLSLESSSRRSSESWFASPVPRISPGRLVVRSCWIWGFVFWVFSGSQRCFVFSRAQRSVLPCLVSSSSARVGLCLRSPFRSSSIRARPLVIFFGGAVFGSISDLVLSAGSSLSIFWAEFTPTRFTRQVSPVVFGVRVAPSSGGVLSVVFVCATLVRSSVTRGWNSSARRRSVSPASADSSFCVGWVPSCVAPPIAARAWVLAVCCHDFYSSFNFFLQFIFICVNCFRNYADIVLEVPDQKTQGLAV
jgi:hypothetical protein